MKGICGDEMEFYLYVRRGIIEDVKYSARGCEFTCACAAWVAKSAMGRGVFDALDVSPKQILDDLPELPALHRHCAILAVNTFIQAIADYLLKP